MAPRVSTAPLRVRIVVPERCRARACDTLYMDDGQDADAVQLVDTLAALEAAGAIDAPIVVAIDAPPDRMGAYGFSDRAGGHGVVAPTKYGDVGARAQAYATWLVRTLVPLVDARYRGRAAPAGRMLLGWSLGGAQAFDVAWQYPDVFAGAGAFSPSFWLATDRHDAASIARTRIAQVRVATTTPPAASRFFIAIGTDEETDDRDGDGVNDALDDVRELVDGWNVDAHGLGGLRQAGYRVTRIEGAGAIDHRAREGDVALYVLDGGRHQQASWARMLPVFLRWAYAATRR